MLNSYLKYNNVNILKKIFLFFLTILITLIIIFSINFKNLEKYDANLILKLPYLTDKIYEKYPLNYSYEQIVLLKDIYYRIYEILQKPSKGNFDYKKNIDEFMYENPSNHIKLQIDFYLKDKNKINQITELINEDLKNIELETKLLLSSYLLKKKNIYFLKVKDDLKIEITNIIKYINQEIEYRKKYNKKLTNLNDIFEDYFIKQEDDFSNLYTEYLKLNTLNNVANNNFYDYSDLDKIIHFLETDEYNMEINFKKNIFDEKIQYIESKDFKLFTLHELTFSKKISMINLVLFSIIFGSLIFIFMINFNKIIRLLKFNFKIS